MCVCVSVCVYIRAGENMQPAHVACHVLTGECMKMGGASHTGTQPHTHTHKHSHTTVSALVVAAGRQAGDAAPALESAGRLHEHRHSAAGISRRKGALAVRLVFVCVCVCMTHVHLAFPLFPLSLFPFSPFPLSSFPLSSCPFPLSSFPFPFSPFPFSPFPLSSCPFPLSSFPFLIPPPFPSSLFAPIATRACLKAKSCVAHLDDVLPEQFASVEE